MKVNKASEIKGIVKAPPSKSYTHRAIIIASIAEGVSTLYDPLSCDDTMATYNACKEFGAEIDWFIDHWVVKGVGGKFKMDPNVILDVKNSGITLRILIAISTLFDHDVIITGDESLRKRSIQPLIDSLNDLGANIKSINNNGKAPFHICPGFDGGITKMPGNITSPFIPVILFAGILSNKSVTIEIEGPLLSESSFNISFKVVSNFTKGKDFNELVSRKYHEINKNNNISTTFSTKQPCQKLIANDFTIEGDYTSASYILSAVAILGGELTVKNLFKDSKQGNKFIIDILREMGAEITIFDDAVEIKSDGNLKGINIDLSDSPDLLPTVAVLGALAKGETNIYNVEVARFNESDRIATCYNELNKLGCNVEEKIDGLKINGGICSGVVNSHGDHRLAMAFSLIGLKQDLVVENAELIDISFPNFIETMAEIGIEMELFD